MDFNVNFMNAEAIFTACLLSALSTLILSNNNKLNHYGKLKYPILVIGNFLNLASYFFLVGINIMAGVLWFLITGLPTFYLYAIMFVALKNELERIFER